MADQEIKNLLQKNLEASEKSLVILEKLHRQMVLRRIFHTIKWVVIVGLLIWGFVAVQPFLDQIAGTIENINQFIPGR